MRTVAVTALLFGLTGLVGLAADPTLQGDPTGTWKWSTMFKDQKREQTLKLKLENGKLTGALLGRKDMETKIEDATFKDGMITFSVTRTRGDQKFVTKYSGKLEGDTIKGTIETERGGESRKQEWEAKRSKD